MLTIKRPKDKVEHTYTYLSTMIEKDHTVTIRLLDEQEERLCWIHIDKGEAITIAHAITEHYQKQNPKK